MIRAVVVLVPCDALMLYFCLGFINLGLKVVQEIRFEVIINLNVVVDNCNQFFAGFGNAVPYILYFSQDMKCMAYLVCNLIILINKCFYHVYGLSTMSRFCHSECGHNSFWVINMRVTI